MEALINPFGTQYNPLSIARTLSRILEGKPFEGEELIQHGGLYHSLLHHGAFSRVTSGETLEAINASLCAAHTQLPRLRYLLLTWGTSYVYRLRETGEVVSNCHKLPERLFSRERVDVPTLLSVWTPLLRELLELQPGLQLILTVSPVRHLRDGAHANTLSKATLHLFTEELQRLFPDHVHYFPAYELVLDELRDYRFYAEDMAHPSTLTQRLVAERFAGWALDEPTLRAFAEAQRITSELRHRPLHASTEAHTQRLERLAARVRDFLSRYPLAKLPSPESHI